jgi:cytochrome c-type biogenesis protein CcmH/NrfG
VDPVRLQTLLDQVAQNPRNFDALAELGNISFDQSKFNEAAGWYEKALEVEPQNANLHADLGTTYFYAQRIDDSITEFQKSLALDPTHPQALYNIGVAFLHGKNNPQGALESWERLVQAHPTYPRIDVVKQQIEALKAQQSK